MSKIIQIDESLALALITELDHYMDDTDDICELSSIRYCRRQLLKAMKEAK